MRHIISFAFIASLSFTFIACSSADEPAPPPDAPPVTTVPRNPAGEFAVITRLDLEPPPAAQKVIIALDRAASDPSRFILDKMVATLPDGTMKTVVEVAVPFVAAYLDTKLATIAPRFVPGLRAISSGFARIASHVELLEGWRIEPAGYAVRTIGGVRFDVGPPAIMELAAYGLPDITATPRVSLDETGQLVVAHHAITLRYGAIVRAGLDLAVVPSAEPGSHDVASALSALVDCAGLGQLVADKVGFGSALLYRGACITAMVAVADELHQHVVAIDAAPLVLELAGAAVGVDGDHDGTMDVIKNGRWSGTVTATFAGARAP
jgi:hypothetical protein